MPVTTPVVVILPIADRRRSFDFCHHGLGFEPIGEPADDGVPEPLQFGLNEGLRLMLVPTGGFDWVIGDRTVHTGGGECLLSLSAASEAGVDDLVDAARRAGAVVVTSPERQPWGYTAVFTDPDSHLWMVEAQSFMAPTTPMSRG